MDRMRRKDFSYGSTGVYCIATTTRNDKGNAGDVGLFKEMTPMAYVPSATSLRDIPLTHAPAQKSRGLFSRLLAAMMVSRQREAEREIARYIAGSGGKFTDETEREIERRFLSQSHW
jgi:hypothetical protein